MVRGRWLFFIANADNAMKVEVHQGTEIPTEALVEKYLGLPTAIGRSSDDQFEHIVASIKKLVNGWAPKLLNSAGREVLIKSICQAILTYSMSCFKLSKKLLKKITAVVARFWWGGDETKRKMHWVKWEELTSPKGWGGMGFKDFGLFNKAMLAKQGWRLLSKPDSLCARVLKGKYYNEGNFMSAGNKRNSSHTWKAILYGREALKLGLIKRIGDGATTKIWEEPWIPSNPTCLPTVRLPTCDMTMVEELLNPITGQWREDAVLDKFAAVDARAILSIPLGRLDEDLWAWRLETNGLFSVRSAYRALLQAPNDWAEGGMTAADNPVWKKLWKMSVPPKVSNFWWRVIKSYIPCRAVLTSRHMEKLPFCRACGRKETIKHALFECTWVKLFWQEIRGATSVKIPDLHPDSWALDIIDSDRVSRDAAAVI